MRPLFTREQSAIEKKEDSSVQLPIRVQCGQPFTAFSHFYNLIFYTFCFSLIPGRDHRRRVHGGVRSAQAKRRQARGGNSHHGHRLVECSLHRLQDPSPTWRETQPTHRTTFWVMCSRFGRLDLFSSKIQQRFVSKK